MADATEPVVDDPTKAPEVEPEVDPDTGKPKEPEKADEQTPGTPDKALQRMQQELGNVTRQLAALTEKKAEQGTLSEADKAKLAKAQDRIARIREYVDDPVAEQVLDLNDRLSEQDKLKTELADTKARLAALESDRGWSKAKEKYHGLDVEAIWDKATKDAGETLGDAATEKTVSRLASRWFEERCDAAMKRLKDSSKTNNRETDAPAPSTYKVGTATKTAPVLSDEDEALAMARSLVREI